MIKKDCIHNFNNKKCLKHNYFICADIICMDYEEVIQLG